MKKILIRDFYNFNFLSNLSYSPKKDKVVFVKKEVDEKNNDYKSFLYLYQNNKFSKITNKGKEANYIFKNNDEILLFTVNEKCDLKRTKNLEVFTCIYLIDLKNNKTVKKHEIPISVDVVKQVNEYIYLISSIIDESCPDYYKLAKKERIEIQKQNKQNIDYEVCDETPFYFNGRGFTNKKRTALFIYNLKNNKLERITKDNFNTNAFDIIDNNIVYAGNFITNRAFLDNACGLYEYSLKDRNHREIISERDHFDIYTITKFQNSIVLLVNESKKYGENENPVIYTLCNDKIKPLFTKDISFGNSTGSDCRLGGGKTFKVHNDKLYFIETRRNAAILTSIDANGKQEDVLNIDGSIDLFDINKDNEIMLVHMNATSLQEIYLFKDNKLKQLSRFNQKQLEGKYVAVPEKITVESRKTEIDGWILKPINYSSKKKYPLILDIHGGPKTVYGEIYYHEMQVWASKGYFVCFCNPTGSDGRGNKFADIRGKYGTIDYLNIMDFLDRVLDKYPQIDKKKLCVTGGSYGGFMTNWIVGHTDRFACGATQRSISNWISFEGTSDIGIDFTKDQQDANIQTNFNKLWKHSPLKYADKVKTPLLFIHSDEDYRCPLEQGIQFFTAIRKNNIPSRLVIFHGENHELSRGGKPKHREKRLEEITNWFELYTK